MDKKKPGELLHSSFNSQNMDEKILKSDLNDNIASNSGQMNSVMNEERNCGIGRKLRKKQINTAYSSNGKNPPFKIKAHKVNNQN